LTYTDKYLRTLTALIAEIDRTAVEYVVDLFWANYQNGGRLVFCGNGGSAASASHLPADFQKNVFLEGGRPWECMSLVDSIPLLTAWGNDTDYANIFAGQAKIWLRPGDLLVAISGSGNSPNILAAVETANEIGATTIGWCGYGGGKLANLAHHAIVLQSTNMQMVEDIHMILGHLIFTEIRDRIRKSTGRLS
jgi:D-sedoheptulose 7-phosphate isomerase